MIVLLGTALAVAIIVGVMWMLLTRRMREKYAVLWLLLGLVLLVLGLFPGLLESATRVLGVQLPVNLLFAAAIAVLLGVSLHVSWELSQSEDEARRLAEEVAILGLRVDALERAADAQQSSGGSDADPRPSSESPKTTD
ncbi:DUF2304 domain-containing protein [Microbacterium gorillae]|uniref:DUF2304 domain-containing protein n=1 Tax=Microbacterium gorillae TaxID=1231063 RepID=UPI003D99F685